MKVMTSELDTVWKDGRDLGRGERGFQKGRGHHGACTGHAEPVGLAAARSRARGVSVYAKRRVGQTLEHTLGAKLKSLGFVFPVRGRLKVLRRGPESSEQRPSMELPGRGAEERRLRRVSRLGVCGWNAGSWGK